MTVVFDLVAARRALDAGRADEALRITQLALEAFPGDAEALALLAEALLALERWRDGLLATDRLLQATPDSVWAYRLRCVALGGLGRDEEMLDAALHAVRLAPDNANAHFLLAKGLWNTSREADARQAIERAISLEPEVPLYRTTLAAFVFDAEPDAAESLLRRIVADEPRRAAALNDLGVLLQRKANLKEARSHYERAVKADPSLEAARDNLEHLDWPVARWKLGFAMGCALLVGVGIGPAFGALFMWRGGHPLGAAGFGVVAALGTVVAVVALQQAAEAKRTRWEPTRS